MTFDLTAPAVQQDPYPLYADLRRRPDIARVSARGIGTDVFFVTRYAEAVSVLKDPRFVNDVSKLPGRADLSKKWFMPAVLRVLLNSMVLKDEPDHTRLRHLVHKVFTPGMIQQLSGRIEQIANDLLDAAASKREIDFIEEFSLPLPLTVIGDMMGVPPRDRPKFRRWMSNTLADASTRDLLSLLPKLRNAFELNRFLQRLVATRRAQPQDDLTTALVQAQEAGDRLTEPELISMLFLILFAGHETTVNLVGSGTLALLQHADEFAKLKAHPELLDSAIEELLRYANPVQHIAMRYPLEDVTLGDTTVPRHSTVLIGIAAANRDETVFEHADRLEIARDPNRHIAFGFGIHYCLGAPLARLEAKIAFSVLFRRFPNLTLAAPADTLTWRGAPALRGLVRMPVRLNG